MEKLSWDTSACERMRKKKHQGKRVRSLRDDAKSRKKENDSIDFLSLHFQQNSMLLPGTTKGGTNLSGKTNRRSKQGRSAIVWRPLKRIEMLQRTSIA